MKALCAYRGNSIFLLCIANAGLCCTLTYRFELFVAQISLRFYSENEGLRIEIGRISILWEIKNIQNDLSFLLHCLLISNASS